MSKYTTQVRFICETAAGLAESAGFDKVEEIVQKAAPKVFSFNFPIFDENYRATLEEKILLSYYTREICEETVGLWKLRLGQRLNEIMPYYNKLYESELLTFNPLYDVDITRDHNTTNDGTNKNVSTDNQTVTKKGTETHGSTGNISVEDVNWDLYSDTPQGGINGIDVEPGDVGNNTYLTNARKIHDNTTTGTKQDSTTTNDDTDTTVGNGTNDTTIHNTEDYLEHVKGKQGTQSYATLLSEYRKTFLNIDALIIHDLQDLFFGLWE